MKKILSLVLALALAMCVTLALAEEEAPAEEEEVEVALMTYEEFALAETNAPVYIETYVQAHQGWYEKDGIGRMSLYLQSPEGATFAYDVNMDEETSKKLVPGTKIGIWGYKEPYKGLVEIQEAEFEVLEGEEPFIAEAKDVTELFGTDDLIDEQSKKIVIKGAKVVAYTADGTEIAGEIPFAYDWDNSGSRDKNGVGADLYFKVEVNGQPYTMTVESYLCGNETDVYKAVEALQVGQTVDLEGFLYWYDGANPHITNVTVVE